MSMLFLLIAFGVIFYLILWQKWSTTAASVAASFVLIVLDGIPIWNGLQQTYAAGLGSSTGNYFFLLCFGALFGHFMSASGCALKIARVLTNLLGKKNVTVTLFTLTALMVYGGISVLVVVFTVGPVGLAMMREANLPRRHLAACILAGGSTLSMTSLPGIPNLLNLMPTGYLGTDAMAAPVIGIIGSIIQYILCVLFLLFIEKRYISKGMGFEENVATSIVQKEDDFGDLPNGFMAFLPTLILICSVLFLSRVLTGGSTPAAVLGSTVACIVIYLTNRKRFKKRLGDTITEGMQGGLNAAINMAAMVGFGVVIQSSSAFVIITDFVTGLSSGGGVVSVLLSLFVAVSIFVATTASAGSGLDIFWKTMGDRFISTGVNPQLLHRISCMAAGGFDTVPHNSAYPVFNSVLGTETKEVYPLVAVLTLTIPVVSCIICIFLAGMGLV